MKKLLLLCSIFVFLVCGCGKFDSEKAVKEFTSDVNGAKSYKLKGSMEIVNNEETFTYSLETYYLKDNYYKVILINQTNNHEQIILKNKDGVYVVTPSLNKSFKFQSEWPFNSSQAYILSSLVDDVKNDDKTKLEETENNYILKTKVNYPNNAELAYQKINFDKKMNIEGVEVYNSDDIVKIKVSFTSVDLKAGLEEEDFLLEELIDEDCCSTDTCDQNECQSPNKTDKNDSNEIDNENNQNSNNETNNNNTQQSSSLENIMYPLYIPSNTHLKSSEKVDMDSGDRVILTFSGDKDFILIQETTRISSNFETIPVFGDPIMVSDTVAALSSNSLSWTANNVNYYLASNELSQEEMLTIASSLGDTKTVIESK